MCVFIPSTFYCLITLICLPGHNKGMTSYDQRLDQDQDLSDCLSNSFNPRLLIFVKVEIAYFTQLGPDTHFINLF